MAEEAVKRLEARIVELENELKTLRGPQPTDISADEVQAYLKVREVVDWEGGCKLCGPCIVWPSETISRCVRLCACLVECTCGPCNIGGFERGGLSRFSALGG